MLRVLRHYWPEIKKYQWLLVLMFIGMTIVVGLDLVLPYILRNFAETLALDPQDNPEALNSLMQNLMIFVGIYFGMWLIWRVNNFAIVAFETRAMRDLENRAFVELHKQPLSFFKNCFTGSLVKKVNRFTNAFEKLVDILYFHFYKEFTKIFCIFLIFLMEKPFLALIYLVWATFYLIGSYLFATWKLKYDLKAATADSRVSGRLADSFANYASVKTYARQKEEAEGFREFSFDRYKKRRLTWILATLSDAVQAFLMWGFELLSIYFFIQWWKAGEFSIGDYVFFQSYFMLLFMGLWDFSRYIQRVFEQVANVKEMVEIFENDLEVYDHPQAKALKIKKGMIEFKNLTFVFREDQHILFKNLNLKIKGGERIALVGPSGSGKSTLINLMFRFFDPSSGDIWVDGQNIKKITQYSLHRHISLVPQNPELFHRTIAENIAFGKPDATRKEIEEAARLSHSNDFIAHLSKGYDTLVGERGVKLSGGEKQRIAIARAFLENAPILVLDEATSSLDSITEKAIQDSIAYLMQGRTSIVIAHRLSTILNMDRIIVIKKGQIMEEGSHQALLRKKGLYAQLWDHQAGGFIGDY